MSGKNKTNFLFGVGCEKGGSTWLHNYLAELPDTQMSEPKELHIFNSRYLPKEHAGSFRFRLKQFLNATQNVSMHKALSEGIGKDFIRTMHMYYDTDVYVDYFRGCAKDEGINLVGEITPLYSILSQDHFAEIHDLLTPHFNVKLVFYMRDPIERIYSLLKMKHRNAVQSGEKLSVTAEHLFLRYFASDACKAPTLYDKIIKNIEAVFGRDAIYYGFYEQLFDDIEVGRLCNFLGVEYQQPDFGKRLNASRSIGELSAEAIDKARVFYDETYKFCAKRFGEDTIKQVWANY